jgi:hypothetical protein
MVLADVFWMIQNVLPVAFAVVLIPVFFFIPGMDPDLGLKTKSTLAFSSRPGYELYEMSIGLERAPQTAQLPINVKNIRGYEPPARFALVLLPVFYSKYGQLFGVVSPLILSIDFFRAPAGPWLVRPDPPGPGPISKGPRPKAQAKWPKPKPAKSQSGLAKTQARPGPRFRPGPSPAKANGPKPCQAQRQSGLAQAQAGLGPGPHHQVQALAQLRPRPMVPGKSPGPGQSSPIPLKRYTQQ